MFETTVLDDDSTHRDELAPENLEADFGGDPFSPPLWALPEKGLLWDLSSDVNDDDEEVDVSAGWASSPSQYLRQSPKEGDGLAIAKTSSRVAKHLERRRQQRIVAMGLWITTSSHVCSSL